MDPFFTTKPVGKGTGLGLSIVHQIIEEHEGQLLVDSKVGAGTRFTLGFPVRRSGSATKDDKKSVSIVGTSADQELDQEFDEERIETEQLGDVDSTGSATSHTEAAA